MTWTAGVIEPGRVAVVTGAAGGIGLALATRFAAVGMRVVLADVEPDPLADAAGKLAAEGNVVLAVPTDVRDPAQVDALRNRTLDAFGAVHLLCNNAGVGSSHQPVWESPPAEWDWVLGVNLHGVLHGLRSFVPTLIAQDAAHVVNTASVFGLFAGAMGAYGVSKHAVVALTETLHFQLAGSAPHVGVSVLCPGAVATRISSSDRNRPDAPPPSTDPKAIEPAARMDALLAQGRAPAEVADLVVDAVRTRRFYVLTSENRNAAIARRAQEILAGGPPAPPLRPPPS